VCFDFGTKFCFSRFGDDTFIIREMIGMVTQYVNSEFELHQVQIVFFSNSRLLRPIYDQLFNDCMACKDNPCHWCITVQMFSDVI